MLFNPLLSILESFFKTACKHTHTHMVMRKNSVKMYGTTHFLKMIILLKKKKECTKTKFYHYKMSITVPRALWTSIQFYQVMTKIVCFLCQFLPRWNFIKFLISSNFSSNPGCYGNLRGKNAVLDEVESCGERAN